MTLSKARDIWEIISRDFLSEIVSRLTGTYNAANSLSKDFVGEDNLTLEYRGRR